MRIDDLKNLSENPFKPNKKTLKKLANSIKEMPELMAARPIIINLDNVVLAGNKRLEALKMLGYKEIPDEWVKKIDTTDENVQKRIIVTDNAHFGSEWDFLLLDEWEVPNNGDWGIWFDVKETEKLSSVDDVDFQSIYHEPIKNSYSLKDCLDFGVYEKKMQFLESLKEKIDIEAYEVLKLLAYRFIRIDFEAIANYYFTTDNDFERQAIERLRLVLIDAGIDGFIEDDLLKIVKNAEI